MAKKIKLSNGLFAIVDDNDFDALNQHKWNCCKGYAMRRVWVGDVKYRAVMMHRLINETPEGFDTDHINGNRLDNQHHNLRTATQSQNIQNRKKYKGVSRFKGVTFSKKTGRWNARITVNKVQKFLGSYNCEIVAAMAYNSAASQHFGQFASLN